MLAFRSIFLFFSEKKMKKHASFVAYSKSTASRARVLSALEGYSVAAINHLANMLHAHRCPLASMFQSKQQMCRTTTYAKRTAQSTAIAAICTPCAKKAAAISLISPVSAGISLRFVSFLAKLLWLLTSLPSSPLLLSNCVAAGYCHT